MALRQKQKKVAYQGFVNVSLTVDRRKAVRELADKSADLEKWLDELTSLGYKVSFGYTEKPACYTVTGYQTDKDSDHAGYATSGRHLELDVAFAALYYGITVVLADEGWPLNDGEYGW